MGIHSLLGFGASWRWGQSPALCLRDVGKHCIPHAALGVGGIEEEEASPAPKMQKIAFHFPLHCIPGRAVASLSRVFLGATQISLGLCRSRACWLDVPVASRGFLGCDGARCAPSPCSHAGLRSSTGSCHCRCESLCVLPRKVVPFSPWPGNLDVFPRVSISLYLKRSSQPLKPS